MEVELNQCQDTHAVKHFFFANVEPRQLLVVHYNPQLPLQILTSDESVLVFAYDGVKLAFAQSPIAADDGRLTSTVYENRINCLLWETRGRTDLIFMNALSDATEPPIEVRAGYPRNAAKKGPTKMRLASSTAHMQHAVSSAGTNATADSDVSGSAVAPDQ